MSASSSPEAFRSVAADALVHGRLAVSRSFRFHRPRGAFCGRGYCGLCEVETEGGRVLACVAPAGTARPRGADPLRPLGRLAERWPPWFYERRALRAAPALHLMRRLSAAGRLGGAAAARARAFREETLETAIVGEGGNVGGTVVGVYEGNVLGVVRDHELAAIAFERLVLATGCYDVPPPVPGNDLPGVIGLAALEAFAEQGALAPGLRVAVWGPPERVARAAAAGAEIVWSGATAPAGVLGRGRVRAIEDRDGRRHECDLLVTAVAQPALELAAQAGAELALSSEGLPVLVAARLPEGIELRGEAAAGAAGVPAVRPAGDAFACLCEDVRVRDVRRAIAEGFDVPELVKRRTGAMTGPCQGKLCAATVLSLLRDAGRAHAPTTARAPARSLTLAELAADA